MPNQPLLELISSTTLPSVCAIELAQQRDEPGVYRTLIELAANPGVNTDSSVVAQLCANGGATLYQELATWTTGAGLDELCEQLHHSWNRDGTTSGEYDIFELFDERVLPHTPTSCAHIAAHLEHATRRSTHHRRAFADRALACGGGNEADRTRIAAHASPQHRVLHILESPLDDTEALEVLTRTPCTPHDVGGHRALGILATERPGLAAAWVDALGWPNHPLQQLLCVGVWASLRVFEHDTCHTWHMARLEELAATRPQAGQNNTRSREMFAAAIVALASAGTYQPTSCDVVAPAWWRERSGAVVTQWWATPPDPGAVIVEHAAREHAAHVGWREALSDTMAPLTPPPRRVNGTLHADRLGSDVGAWRTAIELARGDNPLDIANIVELAAAPNSTAPNSTAPNSTAPRGAAVRQR